MRRRESRGPVDLPLPKSPFLPLFGGNLVLDFVNTIDRQRPAAETDFLFPGYANLISWCHHAGIVSDGDASAIMRLARRDPLEAVAVRRRATILREAIFQLLTSHSGHHLEPVTCEWRSAVTHRSLSGVEDSPIATWVWDTTASLDYPLWVIGLDAIALITSGQRLQVGQCASPTCQYLFLDTTKNRSRKFCRADVCGNRSRVQRFREIQRPSGETPS